jgi:1-acyl-sn-glycerol-3-phosphate acyltransferase
MKAENLQGISRGTWRFYRVIRWFMRLVSAITARTRVKGLEHMPETGAFLIMPNHTCGMDPFWAGCWVPRPLHFMASEQLWRHKVPGMVLGALGAFPKKKFVRDDTSMALLEQLIARGHGVMIFPEGSRTFDGEQLAIRTGTGRLVKRLGVPVWPCRIKTGHLWHPRWAHWPRWVRVEVEYLPPIRFPDDLSPEEIIQQIGQLIRIEPTPDGIGGTGIFRAEGLPEYLFLCPVCLSFGGLQTAGMWRNDIQCSHCERRWRVEINGRLSARSMGTEDTTIIDARKVITERFGTPPVFDRERFETDGVIYQSTDVRFGHLGKGKMPDPVAEGTLTLTADRLEIHNGAGEAEWGIALGEILAVSMEVKNVLQIRLTDGLYQIDPSHESTPTWDHFLRPWHRAAKTALRAAREASVTPDPPEQPHDNPRATD